MDRSSVCNAILAVALVGCGRIGFDAGGVAEDAGEGDAAIVPDFSGGDPAVRSRLVLDRHTPGEELLDFPLLVTLDDVRADQTLFGEDGETVRVRDARGTVIAHEIDELGVPGMTPTLVWVRVPRYAGSATVIYVEYGGTPAPAAAGLVWSDTYEGVWHLTSSTEQRDSGPAGRHGAPQNTIQPDDGFIGDAIELDPTDADSVIIPTVAEAHAAITVSAWVFCQQRSPSVSMYSNAITQQVDDTEEDTFLLGLSPFDRSTFTLGTDEDFYELEGSVMTFSTWTHLTGTWSAGTMRLYVNGALDASRAAAGTVIRASPQPYMIGGGRNGIVGLATQASDDFFDGILDEVRYESVLRSDAWIAAQYASMRDAVITYGPIERL